MQASKACYDFIKKQEGFSLHAYLDSGGVPTIGWGTIRYDLKTPVKMGETITEAEAQRQLEIEVHRVEDAITAAVKVPLTLAEFDCLVDLFYNIGTGWCTGKGHTQATLIKLLNQGKYNSVPAQLLLFERDIHGRVVQGLANRRRWEAQMWLAGENDHTPIVASVPQNEPGVMPQIVKPAPATPAIASALKHSWTLRGWAVSVLGLAGHTAEKATGTATSIAQDIQTQVDQAGPFRDLAGRFLGNAEWITLGLVVVGLLIVLSRRLSAAAEQKIG